MNNTITVEVIEPQQPWYWNVAQFLYFWGTLYFKGWQVKVTVNGQSAITEPAPKGPNPLDVAYATVKARELAEGKSVAIYQDEISPFPPVISVPSSHGGTQGKCIEMIDKGTKSNEA